MLAVTKNIDRIIEMIRVDTEHSFACDSTGETIEFTASKTKRLLVLSIESQ